MKVCVFGAGAIGGQLAMRMMCGGAEVSVIARGPHLDAIRRSGLRVVAADGTWHERLPASDEPSLFGPQDMVVCCVKQPALPAVARAMTPLLGPDTPVAFVMNGIPWWYDYRNGGAADRDPPSGDAGTVWHAVGPERVLGSVVYSAAEAVAPGVIEVENPKGRIVLGEPDGSRSERVSALAETISAGGLNTVVSRAIRDDIWSKVISNIASGTLAVLSGATLKDIYGRDACARAVRVVVGEMLAVARSRGASPGIDPEKEIARGLALDHKPSILQDLERGRPMEIDAIYRAPLKLARSAGIETPMTDLLVDLVLLRTQSASLG